MTLKKSIFSGENVTNEQRDKHVTPASSTRLIVKATSAKTTCRLSFYSYLNILCIERMGIM
jgi:hypothetical protein